MAPTHGSKGIQGRNCEAGSQMVTLQLQRATCRQSGGLPEGLLSVMRAAETSAPQTQRCHFPRQCAGGSDDEVGTTTHLGSLISRWGGRSPRWEACGPGERVTVRNWERSAVLCAASYWDCKCPCLSVKCKMGGVYPAHLMECWKVDRR